MTKFRSKAPLRLGLAGGGSDLDTYCNKYGGYVLNSTISLYVHCTIEVTDDGFTEFDSLDNGQNFRDKSVEYIAYNGHMDLFKAVYNRVVKDYFKKPMSVKVTTYSDVPSGSGLGGSSTLVVAILGALTEWLNLPLGEYDLAKIAYEIEREDVGVVGGAQDMYAAAFGGFNFMEFYDNKRVIVNPLRIKSSIIDELEDSLLLFFTKITRGASQIEDEKKSLLSNSSSLNAMHEVKNDAILMKEYLLKGQLKKFAEVLGRSWISKKRVSNNITNQSIDTIFNSACKHGAYSGKLSGAGGGGFMFLFVNPVKKYNLSKHLRDKGDVYDFKFVKDGVKSWKVYD